VCGIVVTVQKEKSSVSIISSYDSYSRNGLPLDYAVYKYSVDKGKHKYRKMGLIFLPAYVCILRTLALAFNFIVSAAMQNM
jgi:hypothetical protein